MPEWVYMLISLGILVGLGYFGWKMYQKEELRKREKEQMKHDLKWSSRRREKEQMKHEYRIKKAQMLHKRKR